MGSLVFPGLKIASDDGLFSGLIDDWAESEGVGWAEAPGDWFCVY